MKRNEFNMQFTFFLNFTQKYVTITIIIIIIFIVDGFAHTKLMWLLLPFVAGVVDIRQYSFMTFYFWVVCPKSIFIIIKIIYVSKRKWITVTTLWLTFFFVVPFPILNQKCYLCIEKKNMKTHIICDVKHSKRNK